MHAPTKHVGNGGKGPHRSCCSFIARALLVGSRQRVIGQATALAEKRPDGAPYRAGLRREPGLTGVHRAIYGGDMRDTGRVPPRVRDSARSEVSEPRNLSAAPPLPAAPLGTTSLQSLQRAVGNRAVGALLTAGRLQLARTPAEQQFALTHGGQVESVQSFINGVPQLKEEDVDEFVLWNFLVDSDVVRKGHKEKLDPVAGRWANELTADPNLGVRVIGYASVTGGSAHNEELARRRAESVRDHLVDLGVPEDQILIDSSGSRLPMDEGESPQSLARNRRVEVSKVVLTDVAQSQSDLDSGLDVHVSSMNITVDSGVDDSLLDDHIVFSLKPTVVQAVLQSASFEPDVEVGMLQFVTSDLRRGFYSAADASGEVLDFNAPPIAGTDYDHCLNAFAPCRDVTLAKNPFSGDPNSPFSTVRPSPGGQNLLFVTRPEVAFPKEIKVPGKGRAIFTAGQWRMTFTVLVLARKGTTVIPLDAIAEWDLDVSISMIVGPDPKNLSRQLTVTSSANGNANTGFLAVPPGFDIEAAMTRPTCNLRETLMDRLCKPTITVSADGATDIRDQIEQAEEELRRAAGRVLPGLSR
jgi:outer membrane protein OmpA-like peptidoglycan-associated protein